jgi:hypothetical protein
LIDARTRSRAGKNPANSGPYQADLARYRKLDFFNLARLPVEIGGSRAVERVEEHGRTCTGSSCDTFETSRDGLEGVQVVLGVGWGGADLICVPDGRGKQEEFLSRVLQAHINLYNRAHDFARGNAVVSAAHAFVRIADPKTNARQDVVSSRVHANLSRARRRLRRFHAVSSQSRATAFFAVISASQSGMCLSHRGRAVPYRTCRIFPKLRSAQIGRRQLPDCCALG